MNLPKSVLSLIVSHLDPGENVRTSSTLASLCLVSKEIRSIATPVLWHKIRIDDMRHSPDRGMVELFYQLGVLNLDGTGKKMKDGTTKEQLGWMKTLGRKCDYDVQKKAWERSRARGRSSQDDEFYPDEENYDMDYDDYGSDDEGYGYGSNRGGDKLDPFKWSANEILDPFSYRQILALEAFPHLRPYVKLVDFHGRLEGVIPSKVIERILKICPNVETVLLQRAQVRYLVEDSLAVVSSLAKHSSGLKRLDITDFDDDTACTLLLSNLAKLTNLRHLSLTFKPREWAEWNETPSMYTRSPLPQQLQSLHIGSTISPSFFPFFSRSSTSSLTSLGVAVRRHIPDLSPFVNLRHLTITYDRIRRAINTLSTLPQSTKLATLGLRFSLQVVKAEHADVKLKTRLEDFHPSEDDSEGSEEEETRQPDQPKNDFIALFRSIPSTVHTLSMPYILHPSEEANFKKALNSKSIPVGLRSIHLVRAADKIGDDSEDEDDLDPEEMERRSQEKWLKSIVRLLEKKGIDLLRVPDWLEEQRERSFLNRTRF